eukprot:jgi/Galph1/5020/GphlegSOOS_G3656.1
MRFVEPSELTYLQKIAQGSGANVFLGTFEGRKVAIRKPRISSIDSLNRFYWEVEVRQQLCHPNVLPLIAVCNKPSHYCTVSPFMAEGTLYELLHERNVKLSWLECLYLFVQIVESVEYLHSRGYVHRDIKTENFLIDENWNLCISDLDLLVEEKKFTDASQAKQLAMEYRPSAGRLKHQVGTLIYLAPEIMDYCAHSFSSDVYSLGVVMNEILTGTIPYIDRKLDIPQLQTILETRFNETKLKRAIIVEGLRPVLASRREYPEKILNIIQHCWSADLASRPSSTEVAKQIRQIIETVGGTSYLQSLIINNGKPLSRINSSPWIEVKETTHEDQAGDWNNDGSTCIYASSSIGVCAVPGLRGTDRMEDRYIILSPFRSSNEHLFAIFDGHGGQECAEFARRNFAHLFLSYLDGNIGEEEALEKCLQDLDSQFLSQYSSCSAGSTSLILYFDSEDNLIVGNLGDSLAILGGGSKEPILLNRQHCAHLCPDERARIQSLGGSIVPVAVSEGTQDRVEGHISLTRALGDRALKSFLIAQPELSHISKEELEQYEWIVLASDGLWDVLNPSQVAGIVSKTVRKGDLLTRRLANEAIERGSSDNITVITLFLKQFLPFPVNR